jgi:antitoxin ChpS
MHLGNLRTVGGSVMVAIPRALLDSLGLKANAKIGMRIDKGRLVIEKPRYKLAELIALCDRKAPLPDKDWLRDGPRGSELL